jgi:hypothetical protein
MSMIEFIEVPEGVFAQQKLVIVDDAALTEKLGKLLGHYSCFLEYNAFSSYTKPKKHTSNVNAHHGFHGHGHNHGHSNNHGHGRRAVPTHFAVRKAIGNDKSADEKNITALLNKISRKNVASLTRQIVMVITSSNIEMILMSILDKCKTQQCFIELYVCLINDVCGKCNDEDKACVYKILHAYIKSFITKREFTDYQLVTNNYQDFCSNMSNKLNIIGTHKTILAILTKILRNNMIDEYFNIMFNEVIQMDKCWDDALVEKHELFLDIMADFTKMDNKFKILMVKYYTTHKPIVQRYSLKSKFKVMDMTKLTFTM